MKSKNNATKITALLLAAMLLFSVVPSFQCFAECGPDARTNTRNGIAYIYDEYYVRNKGGDWKLWSMVYVTNYKKDAKIYWEVSYPGYSKTYSSKNGKDLDCDPVYIPLNFRGKKKMKVSCCFYAKVGKKKKVLTRYTLTVRPKKSDIGFIF